MARVMKSTMKLQYDEVYVGTPEERLANNHGDKEMTTGQDVGHLDTCVDHTMTLTAQLLPRMPLIKPHKDDVDMDGLAMNNVVLPKVLQEVRYYYICHTTSYYM